MTKKEFEELADCQVSQEVYEDIEVLYMAAGGVDNAEFWVDITRHLYGDEEKVLRLSDTMREIAKHIRKADENVRKARNEVSRMERKSEDLINFVIENPQSPMR